MFLDGMIWIRMITFALQESLNLDKGKLNTEVYNAEMK